MTVSQISAVALQARLANNEKLLLLDVREPHEFQYTHIAGSILIPLSLIPLRIKELDPAQEIIVICHHGMRSQQVANYLVQQGFENIVNLQGGVAAWASECDLSMPRY